METIDAVNKISHYTVKKLMLFYKHSIIELIKPLDIILTREQLVIKVNHSFLRKWAINDDQRIYENEKHD